VAQTGLFLLGLASVRSFVVTGRFFAEITGRRLAPDSRPAVNADIPNSSVRKSGMLKIIEVLEG
jgi:hypothetical protein